MESVVSDRRKQVNGLSAGICLLTIPPAYVTAQRGGKGRDGTSAWSASVTW